MNWERARQAAVVSWVWEYRPGELHTFTSKGRNTLSMFPSVHTKAKTVKFNINDFNRLINNVIRLPP